MRKSSIKGLDTAVSAISIGAMSLDYQDHSTSRYILDKAQEYGVNFVDTADLYDQGQNESLIGSLIKDKRSNWLLGTKVGNSWKADGSGWEWKPSKQYILQAVEASLQRLQTDYIDLYQLHGGTLDDPFDDILEAFELLKDQGKIRAYGISSIRPNVFLKYAQDGRISTNLMQYSLLDRRPEEYLQKLEEADVAVLVRGALAQGLLIDKPAKAYLSLDEDSVSEAQSMIKASAQPYNLDPLTLALAYPLAQKAVKTVVAGIRTKAQMDDLAKAIQHLEEVPKEVLSDLYEKLPTICYTDHR